MDTFRPRSIIAVNFGAADDFSAFTPVSSNHAKCNTVSGCVTIFGGHIDQAANIHYSSSLHMIVPAGGLSTDRAEWLSTPANFLMPVKILSKVFRGILCRMIKKQWDNGALIIPEKWIGIDFPSIRQDLVFTLVEAERFIPVLEGLNAYEVYREIICCDPSVCPKCKQDE